MSLLAILVLLSLFTAISTEGAEFEEIGSTRGWSELRVSNAGAIDLLAWCGATNSFLAPLRHGRVQMVDVKARTISYFEFGGNLGRLHCSPDGRYVFSSGIQYAQTSSGGQPLGYSLRYYDMRTRKVVTVFEGLRTLSSAIHPALVSPQGRYIIGPRSMGTVVTLLGGERLDLIPADSELLGRPVQSILWGQNDAWLIAATLASKSTDLVADIMDIPSGRVLQLRRKTHVRGFTPFWLAADERWLYYRRSDRQAGGGPLWGADLRTPSPSFRLIVKNVLSYDVSATGTIAFSRERGVRRNGRDDNDTIGVRRTVNVLIPGHQERLVRERDPRGVAGIYISRNGRMVHFDGQPFSVLTEE